MKRKPGMLHRAFFFLFLLILSASSGCYLDDRDNVFDARSNNYYKIDYEAKESAWTFMVFAGADNNLEQDILLDINEMQQGMKNVAGINLIVFIDRSSEYSNDSHVLGENFAGGKLFRVTGSKTYELYGKDDILPECRPDNFFDANSGSAKLLKKFIQFSKQNYPADKYALVLSSHGSGASKRSVLPAEKSTDGSSTRFVSMDDPLDDNIYTAEVTDDLTSAESVDLLGYDACLMGSVEVAYQYRVGNGGFEAKVMVASPASEWNYGWNYKTIFQRFAGTGVNVNDENDVIENQGTYEQYFDAESIETAQFGSIMVEEFYDQFKSYNIANPTRNQTETMSCYDLSKVGAVKMAVDALVAAIDLNNDKTGISGLGTNGVTSNIIRYYEYSSESDDYPYHDLYDLSAALKADSFGNISTDLRSEADSLMTVVDEMVLYSFSGTYYNDMSPVYSSFQKGQHGVHIYFPQDSDFESKSGWYNSRDLTGEGGYGKLAWCIDGIDPDSGEIGNWFELLDYWYDSGADGGSNGYTP